MKRKMILGALVPLMVVGGLVYAGATHDMGSGSGRKADMKQMQGMQSMCPMMVEGTHVRFKKTREGAVLKFRTKGDVNELRQRVMRMAEMMNQHHSGAMPMKKGSMGKDKGHGSKGNMAGHGKGMMMQGGMAMMKGMPACHATVETIRGGAKLVLKADHAADAPKLQMHASRMAANMNSGKCPMMQAGAMGPGSGGDQDDHAGHHGGGSSLR